MVQSHSAKKKKKAAKLGFEFSSDTEEWLNLPLCQPPFRITMNPPTEIKWFPSWLVTTGTEQHCGAGESPRKKTSHRNTPDWHLLSRKKILAKFQLPHNWLKRTRKAQHNPHTKSSAPALATRPYLTLQHTAKQAFPTKLCFIFNNHLSLQGEENNP